MCFIVGWLCSVGSLVSRVVSGSVNKTEERNKHKGRLQDTKQGRKLEVRINGKITVHCSVNKQRTRVRVNRRMSVEMYKRH